MSLCLFCIVVFESLLFVLSCIVLCCVVLCWCGLGLFGIGVGFCWSQCCCCCGVVWCELLFVAVLCLLFSGYCVIVSCVSCIGLYDWRALYVWDCLIWSCIALNFHIVLHCVGVYRVWSVSLLLRLYVSLYAYVSCSALLGLVCFVLVWFVLLLCCCVLFVMCVLTCVCVCVGAWCVV